AWSELLLPRREAPGLRPGLAIDRPLDACRVGRARLERRPGDQANAIALKALLVRSGHFGCGQEDLALITAVLERGSYVLDGKVSREIDGYRITRLFHVRGQRTRGLPAKLERHVLLLVGRIHHRDTFLTVAAAECIEHQEAAVLAPLGKA